MLAALLSPVLGGLLGLPLQVFVIEGLAVLGVARPFGMVARLEIGTESALPGVLGVDGPPAFLDQPFPLLSESEVLVQLETTSLYSRLNTLRLLDWLWDWRESNLSYLSLFRSLSIFSSEE